MMMKFKPVYNFQSVEFEMQIESEDDLYEAKRLYKSVLAMLQEVAPEQPSNNGKSQPKEPMATEKQVATLVKLKMDEQEAKKLTQKQAYLKIKELIEG